MALPEGSVFFINEPVVEVISPIIDAQLVAGFDEYVMAQAIEDGACIDMFGVGTKMGVAADAPYYDHGLQAGAVRWPPGDEIGPGKATR